MFLEHIVFQKFLTNLALRFCQIAKVRHTLSLCIGRCLSCIIPAMQVAYPSQYSLVSGRMKCVYSYVSFAQQVASYGYNILWWNTLIHLPDPNPRTALAICDHNPGTASFAVFYCLFPPRSILNDFMTIWTYDNTYCCVTDNVRKPHLSWKWDFSCIVKILYTQISNAHNFSIVWYCVKVYI